MIKVSKIPFIGKLTVKVYTWINREPAFATSEKYWETRYKKGDNSGSGSYNNLAEFKAKIINEFVVKNNIETAIEFGSGDGNQLKYFNFKKYIGFDISETAIALCKDKYKTDSTKQFKLMKSYIGEKAELTLSLDVIYHLVEDEVFDGYMNKLFMSSINYVIVYSSNSDDHENNGIVPHVKHRKFSNWVEKNAPEFALIECIPNKYPYDGNGDRTTYADFYIFKKQN